MKTLSKLSKFLGCYAEWQQLREDFGLVWTEDDDVTTFRRMTEGDNIEDMMAWVNKASKAVPDYAGVLRYACLTGLRAAEVFLSLGLPNAGYHNDKDGILEHYRYPELFIRPKKKAFLSVMTPEIMKLRADCKPDLSYNTLRLALRRKQLPMNMQYCRRIHGTFLKQKRIDTETIDLLHGRLPTSVFLRFYNRPGFSKELTKVRACLDKLSLSIR